MQLDYGFWNACVLYLGVNSDNSNLYPLLFFRKVVVDPLYVEPFIQGEGALCPNKTVPDTSRI